jgi:hypothetical protein
MPGCQSLLGGLLGRRIGFPDCIATRLEIAWSYIKFGASNSFYRLVETAVVDAKHYVDKAEEFERLANGVKDRVLKLHYKWLADEYRELAEYSFRKKPDGSEPIAPRSRPHALPD